MSPEEKSEPLDTYVSHDLQFPVMSPDTGVAMSETQYLRIQKRIHNEVSKGTATSIWLALAFAFAGFGASAWIALDTLNHKEISGRVIGNLQAGAVGAGALAALCLLVHAGKWLRDRRKGHDICEEMDIYCHRVTAPQERLSVTWWQVIRKVLVG